MYRIYREKEKEKKIQCEHDIVFCKKIQNIGYSSGSYSSLLFSHFTELREIIVTQLEFVDPLNFVMKKLFQV